MAKIKVKLSIGFPAAIHQEILEIPDDATEKEKEEIIQEWGNQYIDLSYEDIEEEE